MGLVYDQYQQEHPQGQLDNQGYKHLFRLINSIRVVDVIEICGELVTCLKMGCKRRHTTYRTFLDAFHKLYLSVGMFTNNARIIRQIEDAFDDDWSYNPDDWDEFYRKALKFINLFKMFEDQLRIDGVYDPVITHYLPTYQDQWKKSI